MNFDFKGKMKYIVIGLVVVLICASLFGII
jgi:hypothetical protein